MKLKLEMQQNVAVLSVLESVVVQDVAVLKAGLNKLIQSGRKSLVLDLTALPEGAVGESAISEISHLPAWASSLESQLVVASPIQALGQAPDREKAIQMMGSPLARLLAQESRLTAQVTQLQQRKAQMEQSLSNASKDGDMRTLLQEHSQLKSLIESLESHLRLLLKGRKEPFAATDTAAKKREILEDTVISILRERQMLPQKQER